jgi:hypothetical protein
MANPNKQDANQNQHNHKSMAAGAGAGTGASAPDVQHMDSPENVGGERPNASNTGSMKKNQTDESLKLSDAGEQPARNNY